MTVTAVARLFFAKASFWYKFSRCSKAARSVEMTCRASLIAETSGVGGMSSFGSGGVIGRVGIGSDTGAGHVGIEGVSGVGRAAWLVAMPNAIPCSEVGWNRLVCVRFCVIEGYPYLEKEMKKKKATPKSPPTCISCEDEKFNDSLRGKLSSTHLEFG
jgi:hypothetical protein